LSRLASHLAHSRFGEQGPPLLILHGLLGSSRNWHGMAQALAERFQVAAIDLRNHGASPHADSMDYPAMAGDLLELLDDWRWPQARVIGHSMGGKLAMYLATAQAERVESLLIADIAPAAYAPEPHSDVLDAMEAVPLAEIRNRQDADACLAEHIPDRAMRLFLLQNLVATADGYRWRINLPAIRQHLPALSAPPPLQGLPAYRGEALFLAGEQSNYVRPEHHPAIGRHFPKAHIRTLHGAGHWPHVEQPAAFLQAVQEFFAGD
jgi:pimeloyl-ACP methyl ester carboxylesterase